MQELIECVNGKNESDPAPPTTIVKDKESALRDLRNMMKWDEIRENGPALATLARTAKRIRES